MLFRIAIPVVLLLSAAADLPHLFPPPPAARGPAQAFPPDERIPLYPTVLSGDDQNQCKLASAVSKANSTLQEMSKLKLIRYVSGEFA